MIIDRARPHLLLVNFNLDLCYVVSVNCSTLHIKVLVHDSLHVAVSSFDSFVLPMLPRNVLAV